jgi:hypothetical protein
MAENEKESTNWGAITGVVVLVAIIVGLLYYYYTSQVIPAIGIPLLIIGVFEVLSSIGKSSTPDQFGTSESYAATVLGFLLIAIGGAMLVFIYSDSIIFPIVFALVVIILFFLVSMAKRKKE